MHASDQTLNFRHLAPWIALGLLLVAGLACAPFGDGGTDQGSLETQVAATLNSVASETAEQGQPPATATPTEAASATPNPSETPTVEPPDQGSSLNCDGTFQRVRLIDRDNAGRSLVVDQWTGSGWQQAWQFDVDDPNIRQLTDRAGAYSFGGCQQLLVVPLLYSGSGAVIELHVFQWTGDGVAEVYSNNGTHGDWQIAEDQLHFERSLYLYDEPNCCPCNRETEVHEWNGTAFIKEETEIRPTYTGTPPPICRP